MPDSFTIMNFILVLVKKFPFLFFELKNKVDFYVVVGIFLMIGMWYWCFLPLVFAISVCH
jgi:hypothetical protein